MVMMKTYIFKTIIYLFLFFSLTSCATYEEKQQEAKNDMCINKPGNYNFAARLGCLDQPPKDISSLCRLQNSFWNQNKKYAYQIPNFSKQSALQRMATLGITKQTCLDKYCLTSIFESENPYKERKSCEQQKEVAKQKKIEFENNVRRENKCLDFGFQKNTKEMSECMFELYKLEVRKQQDKEFIENVNSKVEAQKRIMELQLEEQRLNNGLFLLHQNQQYLNNLLKPMPIIK